MTKELKPLEALERLYCAGRLDLDYVTNGRQKEDYELVEKALKEYEELQNDYCKVVEERGKWQKETNKKLKAFEIIKKYIRVGKPFGTACYIYLNDESEIISDKEFDLLKEVLK